MTARAKALVYGRSLAGIMASKPAGTSVCRVACCQVVVCVRRADHSSTRVLPSVVCLSVIAQPRKGEA